MVYLTKQYWDNLMITILLFIRVAIEPNRINRDNSIDENDI